MASPFESSALRFLLAGIDVPHPQHLSLNTNLQMPQGADDRTNTHTYTFDCQRVTPPL